MAIGEYQWLEDYWEIVRLIDRLRHVKETAIVLGYEDEMAINDAMQALNQVKELMEP